MKITSIEMGGFSNNKLKILLKSVSNAGNFKDIHILIMDLTNYIILYMIQRFRGIMLFMR